MTERPTDHVPTDTDLELLERNSADVIARGASRPSLSDRIEEVYSSLFRLSAAALEAGVPAIGCAINAEANRLRNIRPLIDPLPTASRLGSSDLVLRSDSDSAEPRSGYTRPSDPPMIAAGLRALDRALSHSGKPTTNPRTKDV